MSVEEKMLRTPFWVKLKRRYEYYNKKGIKEALKATDVQIYRYLHNRKVNQRNVRLYGRQFMANKMTTKLKLMKRDGKVCQWCKQKDRLENLTIDHVIEVSKGGTNALSNLRLLHNDCHVQRNKISLSLSTSLHLDS